MKLLIVESPTKAKTLNKFLGSGFEVRASMGHIRDLPSNKMNIDIENGYEPNYALVEGKGKVVKELQDLAKKADSVYLAMDPDREGEAIAYHTKWILNKTVDKKTKKDFKRITFHQITKDAVDEAIGHAGKINMELVEAQQARRVLDRLVGYSLSPVLWKKVRRGLSAGRVQSVALRLIVEREAEIDAFKEKEYWEIKVEVDKDKQPFWVDLVEIEGKAIVEGKGDERTFKMNSKKLAESAVSDLKKAGYKVLSVTKKERKQRPKPPHTTSTLQQAAANKFGWTAKRTMSVAQKLYEKGLITYHRTDSFHLAAGAVKTARTYIGQNFGPTYVPKDANAYKTKSKSAQEAHEAIRPSDPKLDPKSVKVSDNGGKKLYGLIWKRMIASQMTPAVVDATTVKVEASGKKKYLLKATGSIVKFAGWRAVYGKKASVGEDDAVLPELARDEKLKYKDIEYEQKFTQPPPRYNDASIVKKLEELGIGRPSTYAPTISTLISRGYMERKDRRYYPTVVGKTVVEFLTKNFKKIMDYDFTANMEDELDKIAEGKRKWVKVMDDFWKPFDKKVKNVTEKADRVKVPVEKLGKKCPECGKKEGGELVIRTGRYGKFISCGRFPDCRYTAKLEKKVKGMKCEKCGKGDIVEKKTRRGRTFWGCNRYPECDWASWNDPSKEKKSKGK